MTVKRRPCERCQINRAERFYVSERGRVCAKCRSGAQKRAAKTAMLRNTYNITYDEWEAIIAAQGGGCPIEHKRHKVMDVDHDHALERDLIAAGVDPMEAKRRSVRGVLTRRVNRRVLPGLVDDPERALRVAAYLTFPPARKILFPEGF